MFLGAMSPLRAKGVMRGCRVEEGALRKVLSSNCWSLSRLEYSLCIE